MNPISDTAFLTCGARAADAASAKPICGDTYAALFLTEHGKRVYDAFRGEAGPLASIVGRHRIMDDLLRARLAVNPDISVIVIGAGFEARAYRLHGGLWTEIDEAQVIDLKNRVLPVDQCRNPLQRIAIDFAQEDLAAKLPAVELGRPVVVVMEGVFIYLSQAQIEAVLDALCKAYPGHSLLCDLHTRHFMERYGKDLARQIEALGASLQFLVDEPSRVFLQAGYRLDSTMSVVGKSLEYANAGVALFFISWFLRQLLDGYSVYVFQASPANSSVYPLPKSAGAARR
jgi:methyltransferase (TIGR00027 family)